MNKKEKLGKKGSYQYIKYEKKRRIIKTAIIFAIAIAILITGILIWDTKENYLTIAAILVCLPAAKQAVSMIMICLYKSMDENKYKLVEQHKGSLTMCYEMILTNYEKNTVVDTFAICGNQVIGYSGAEKIDVKYVEKNTQTILRNNGYGVTVKILKDFNHFIERLDSMNEHEVSLRADISFKPDERYPDLSREEIIKYLILAISL